jgi:hypothetical protein
VNSASGTFQESGLLRISLTADSAITSLSADLFPVGSSSATPAWTVTDFNAPVSGTDGAELYTASAPIPWGTGTGELPLGNYVVKGNAADQGGGSVSDDPAGSIAFLIEPQLTLQAKPAKVDWGHRLVTFSGTVTGIFPDGTTGPVQGAVVTIQPEGQTSTPQAFTATSGADGKYSGTKTVLDWQWQANVTGGTGLDLTGNTLQLVSLAINEDPVRLTAKLAKSNVNYGKPDKITGTVQYKSGSVWKPVAGLQLTVDGTRPGDDTTAETNSAGRYSVTLPHLKVSDEWEVSTGNNAWFKGASVTKSITVNLPVKLERVSEKLSPFGVLSASGCIVYTFPGGSQDQSTAPIWVDYSAGPKGPWHPLGKIRSSWNGTQLCPAVGANWTRNFRVKLASAWYRERVAAVPGIQGAISKAVHLRKDLTKIVNFKVSSRSVPSGGSLTVSGKLEQDTGHWRALGHQVVLIVLRPKGKKTWYWLVKPHTDGSGDFTATFNDPVSATWSATYEGGSKYFASGAKQIYVSLG